MCISPVHAQNVTNATSRLFADVQVFSVDSNGAELPLKKIVVREIATTRSYPLLTSIFFEKNDTALCSYYRRTQWQKRIAVQGTFCGVVPHDDDLIDDDVRKIQEAAEAKSEFHRKPDEAAPHHLLMVANTLLIIGQQLKDTPKAKITLVGFRDEVNSEKTNKSLAITRAELLKRYFVKVWGIEAHRITTKTGKIIQYPPTLANANIDVYGEECRRVDIFSDSLGLLNSLLVFDTVSIVSPEKIRFRVKPTKPTKDWTLNVIHSGSHGSQTLKQLSGYSVENNYIKTTSVEDWNLKDEPATMPRENGFLSIEFTLVDTANIAHTFESSDAHLTAECLSFKIQRALGMKTIHQMRFELPAFAFNQTTVSPVNRHFIKTQILPRLQKDSQILIEGYTDSLETAPKRLSEERAFAVAKLINIGKKTSLGVGNLVQYNPHDPIGRFLNRNVRITVLTPIPAAK
jgi:outer membrane protein OmpA-like peptidoglycan-associated protein